MATAEAPSAALSASAANATGKPIFDQQVWSAVPSLFWALLVVGALVYFRRELRALAAAVVLRIKDGASLKMAGMEIGPSSGPVASQGTFQGDSAATDAYEDKDGSWQAKRKEAYGRGAMLVHRIQRSRVDGQLYDVLIYVIPHKASLAGVSQVEYFLGPFWGNVVYPSQDRSRGFPIVASAYGSFLCLAKISFNDGSHGFVSRYIDLEMGAVAPVGPDVS